MGRPAREPVEEGSREAAARASRRAGSTTCSDPQNALAAVKPLLAEADDDKRADALLERIIEAPKATQGRPRRRARSAALALRRDVAAARGDPRPREDHRSSIRRLARRCARRPARGSPSSTTCPPRWITTRRCSRSRRSRPSTEEKLRQLAERGGHHDRYADGVAAAARASSDPTRRVELLARGRAHAARSAATTPRARSSCSSRRPASAARPSTSSSSSRAGSPRSTRRPTGRRSASRVLERQAHLEANDAARAAILSARPRSSPSRSATPTARCRCGSAAIDSDPTRSVRRSTRGSASSRASSAGTTSSPRSRAAPRKVDVAEPEARRSRARRARPPPAAQRSRRRDRRVAARRRRPQATTRRASRALADLLAETGRWKRDGRPARGRLGPRDRSAPSAASSGSATRCASTSTSRRARSPRIATRSRSIRRARTRAPGLTALLEVAATRAAAADALAQAMRTTGDVAGVLDLLPARLAEAHGRPHAARAAPRGRAAAPRAQARRGRRARRSRARVPARAARSADREPAAVARAGRPATTRRSASRTSRRSPRSATTRARPRGCAWRTPTSPPIASAIRARAADAYAQVAEVEPGNRRAVARVRDARRDARPVGRRRGRDRALRRACARRSTTSCSSILEIAAKRRTARTTRSRTALDDRARQAQAARRRSPRCSTSASRSLHRDQRSDRAGAIAALRRALELGGERQAWLAELVALERDAGRRRRSCSTRCAGSPMPMAAISTRSSAPPMSRASSASASKRCRSCRPCSAARPPRGAAPPRSARRARSTPSRSGRSTALVDLYRTGGRARAAVDTLVEAARLPFDQAHAPRHAAARRAARDRRARRQRRGDRHVSQRARRARRTTSR